MERNPKKALLYALGAVLLWSTVASAFKLTLDFLEPVELLFYASVVSTATLGVAIAVSGRLRLLRALPRGAWLRSAALGLLNPFLYYLILFKAYDLLPAQEAQPLNYTWAVTLALLSIPLLGQRIRARDIVAALICYAGVVVIGTRGDVLGLRFSSPLGVALALLSTLPWALYWIYNTRRKTDPAVALFLNFLLSLPPVFAAFLVWTPVRVPDLRGLAGAAYTGVFEMGLTFLLWLTALRHTDNASRVGNLIFLSPFLSLVLIRFVVGETILASSVLGLALVVAGLLFQRLGARRETSKREAGGGGREMRNGK